MEYVSLKDYLGLVRQAISLGVDHGMWVRAEINELRANSNGHCYLTLIEKEESGRMNICAKASAIIWANKFRIMSTMFEQITGEKLQPGMTVLVNVSPNFHEAYGFSLVIEDIDATFTLGDMARRRQEVIEKLKADGVWDMNHDLEMPALPLRIAIISSPTAAGFGDFTNQLEQNERGFKFYCHLFPAIMQGVDAPASIMEALDVVYEVQDRFDCVAIVRGGGASADMLAFDDYDLASCCAQFPLPILSGVGHERDTCVLDMVAHRRCKTPTAVAAFLIDCHEDQYNRLCEAENALKDGAQEMLQSEKERMQACVYGITKEVPLVLAEEKRKLSATSAALKMSVQKRCQREQTSVLEMKTSLMAAVRMQKQQSAQRLEAYKARIAHGVKLLSANKRNRLELLAQKVDLLSPQTLMKKGYTLTLKNGKAVRSAADLQTGDVVTSVFADGRVDSVVGILNTTCKNK